MVSVGTIEHRGLSHIFTTLFGTILDLKAALCANEAGSRLVAGIAFVSRCDLVGEHQCRLLVGCEVIGRMLCEREMAGR